MIYICYIFFEWYGYHRDLHVRTHSFPTRRSSDLDRARPAAACRVWRRRRQAAYGTEAANREPPGHGKPAWLHPSRPDCPALHRSPCRADNYRRAVLQARVLAHEPVLRMAGQDVARARQDRPRGRRRRAEGPGQSRTRPTVPRAPTRPQPVATGTSPGTHSRRESVEPPATHLLPGEHACTTSSTQPPPCDRKGALSGQ